MMKESIIVPHNTPVQDIIRNATNYISKNWNVSRYEILELIISLDLGGGRGVSNNTTEREECADHILFEHKKHEIETRREEYVVIIKNQ